MASPSSTLPKRPVEQITRPLARFLHFQAAGGLVLFMVTMVALVIANTGASAWYASLWEHPLEVHVGEFELAYPLWYWINDGLMSIFFFVIGLEIKRELVWGELRDVRNVILPAIAAVGGAVVPVGLYLGYLHLFADGVGQGGWAIPMATDIAFVVGCLALLGSRIPTSLKIFMLSLAIIDDILAVGIIAVFFSTTIKVGWLFSALGGLGLTVFLNRIGVRRIGVYIFVGSFIWLCTLKSGVHPTIAGVALGLLTPASAWIGNESLLGIIEGAVAKLRQANQGPDGERRAAAQDLATAATESVSPLERLEESLHPWVSFMIMPVFALANAGVTVEGANATEPVTMATSIGLVLGKPLGIVGASWLAVRLRVATLPEGTGWPALVGAACLGGIGFTMALFISSLSMSGPSLAAAKLGILIGSGASLCIGMTVLAITLRPTAPATGNE